MKSSWLSALCGAALVALGAQSALAEPVKPGVWVTVDRETAWIDATRTDEEKVRWYIDHKAGCGDDGSCSLGINALLDPDPAITAGVGVIDFGAASTFGFSFLTPIVPTVGAQKLTLTIGVTCTDGLKDGCSATPVFATLASGSLDGISYVFNGGALVCPPGTPTCTFASPLALTFVAAGPYTALDLHLDFMGSGGDDSYGFSMKVEVMPVPEPATYALLLAGLATVGFVAGRRNKH